MRGMTRSRVAGSLARTVSTPVVWSGTTCGKVPPLVMMACTRTSEGSCWRSALMPLKASSMASSALMPSSGRAAAWAALPK